jgi:hypothetical protein
MHTIMHIPSINIRFLCKQSKCCDSRTVRVLGVVQECQYVHAFEYRQGLLFDWIMHHVCFTFSNSNGQY